MAKKRVPIPKVVQAKVQFESDRTCCVCREKGKPYQIHHIDEDPSNNDPANLSVLCRDCHDQTMIRGGFNRRLSADLVTLYRDDWLGIVVNRRAEIQETGQAQTSVAPPSDFAVLAEKIEILKERGEFGFLAMEYDRLGNQALRDKYVDLAIKNNPSDYTAIFLRGLQGRPDRIPGDTLDRVVKGMKEDKNWSQLARVYYDAADYKNSIVNYCKYVIEFIEQEKLFTAAFYLKELSQKALYVPLFEEEYENNVQDDDLWWAFRCLQELGWTSEARALLLDNSERIEKEEHHFFKKALYAAKGDEKAYNALELWEANTIFDDGDAVGFAENSDENQDDQDSDRGVES